MTPLQFSLKIGKMLVVPCKSSGLQDSGPFPKSVNLVNSHYLKQLKFIFKIHVVYSTLRLCKQNWSQTVLKLWSLSKISWLISFRIYCVQIAKLKSPELFSQRLNSFEMANSWAFLLSGYTRNCRTKENSGKNSCWSCKNLLVFYQKGDASFLVTSVRKNIENVVGPVQIGRSTSYWSHSIISVVPLSHKLCPRFLTYKRKTNEKIIEKLRL